jgi:pyrroline-5-carboxylate reductase
VQDLAKRKNVTLHVITPNTVPPIDCQLYRSFQEFKEKNQVDGFRPFYYVILGIKPQKAKGVIADLVKGGVKDYLDLEKSRVVSMLAGVRIE